MANPNARDATPASVSGLVPGERTTLPTPSAVSRVESNEDKFYIKTHKGISYEYYRGEEQLPEMASLIEQDLSEPYSVYTYRYFLCQWPHLCFLAKDYGDVPLDEASTGGTLDDKRPNPK
jgi:hypothetical protein